MRLLGFTIVLMWVAACGRKASEVPAPTAEPDEAHALSAVADTVVYDYTGLYGLYQHESQSKGFNALIELTPQGNDIQFSLSLTQGSCTATLTGVLGMVDHSSLEYVGFFDNDQCRFQFSYIRAEQKVRIQEVGFCTVHPAGCNFDGTYARLETKGN
jgi:hypothetical protein